MGHFIVSLPHFILPSICMLFLRACIACARACVWVSSIFFISLDISFVAVVVGSDAQRVVAYLPIIVPSLFSLVHPFYFFLHSFISLSPSLHLSIRFYSEIHLPLFLFLFGITLPHVCFIVPLYRNKVSNNQIT